MGSYHLSRLTEKRVIHHFFNAGGESSNDGRPWVRNGCLYVLRGGFDISSKRWKTPWRKWSKRRKKKLSHRDLLSWNPSMGSPAAPLPQSSKVSCKSVFLHYLRRRKLRFSRKEVRTKKRNKECERRKNTNWKDFVVAIFCSRTRAIVQERMCTKQVWKLWSCTRTPEHPWVHQSGETSATLWLL